MRRFGAPACIVLVAAVCIAYQWTVHTLMMQAQTESMRTTLALLNGVPHAAINLLLVWVFGRTLVAGREALITGFARRVHGTLPAYIESYTRRITWAWCIFFLGQIVLSAALLAAAPLEHWSFFINVLSAPLVIVMFVAEYLYRVARFPDFPHVSIWKGVQMFAAHRRGPRASGIGSQNR